MKAAKGFSANKNQGLMMKTPNRLCLCHMVLNSNDDAFLAAAYSDYLPKNTEILLAVPALLKVTPYLMSPYINVKLNQGLSLSKKVVHTPHRSIIQPISTEDAQNLTLVFLTHDTPELLILKVGDMEISSSQASAFATVSLIHPMSECDDSSTEEIEEESSLHKAQELKKLVLNHAQCNSG
jgi:hypothetical protein